MLVANYVSGAALRTAVLDMGWLRTNRHDTVDSFYGVANGLPRILIARAESLATAAC